MRRLTSIALTAPLLLLHSAPAAASCVPTEVAVSPPSAAPGQVVTVSSSSWYGICNDTGQEVDVTDWAVVTFVQGSQRVVLGRTNSNAEAVFALDVTVPEDAVAGPAVLEVRGRSAADDVALAVTPPLLAQTGSDGAAHEALVAVLLAGAGISLVRRLRRPAPRAAAWSGPEGPKR